MPNTGQTVFLANATDSTQTVRSGNLNGQVALYVGSGSVTNLSFGTLTGNASTATLDAGQARGQVTWMVVGTSTLTGTLTLEMSLDGGTNWFTTGSTITLTAGLTSAASTKAHVCRHWRITLSGAGGSGNAVLTAHFGD